MKSSRDLISLICARCNKTCIVNEIILFYKNMSKRNNMVVDYVLKINMCYSEENLFASRVCVFSFIFYFQRNVCKMTFRLLEILRHAP